MEKYQQTARINTNQTKKYTPNGVYFFNTKSN